MYNQKRLNTIKTFFELVALYEGVLFFLSFSLYTGLVFFQMNKTPIGVRSLRDYRAGEAKVHRDEKEKKETRSKEEKRKEPSHLIHCTKIVPT